MAKQRDYRSDVDEWMSMWAEVQHKRIHPGMESVKPRQFSGVEKPQDSYYDFMELEELLQEQKTPNPVYPDSAGPDHETTKPVWVSEDLLKEVEKLKQRLFEVENRVAQMGGKKWTESPQTSGTEKNVFGEIESLKKQIEKVSSTLGIKDEPSPWEVKRG